MWAVRLGWATETNPMLAATLARSDSAFLLIKGASFILPIAALEFIRAKRPEFVARALRIAIGGYLFLYVLVSLLLVPTYLR